MEFFLIIIVGIIIFYLFFRKKSPSVDKDKELKAEAFDLTMKQAKVVAHSKLFDQTDMFLDIVHEGYSQKWTESTYDEEKKAGQESKTIGKFFSYLIVFVISFVALVILVDTIKMPLINVFPELEMILSTLFLNHLWH